MEELVALAAAGVPASVLIKRVSDAVGGLLRPWQVRRIAEAEAEANLIHAQSEININSLQERAHHRARTEEMMRQANMELILAKSVSHLDQDNASPEQMDEDWIVNFFEKARRISDDDMQELWARILAGEANRPGSFSRKTVNIMDDIGESDANMFMNLCSYVWMIGSDMVPLIYSENINTNSIYNKNGIRFLSIKHLEDIGLLRYEGKGFSLTIRHGDTIPVSYFGNRLELKPVRQQEFGSALFTTAGQELYVLVQSNLHPVDGFYDFVYDKWADASLVPPRETSPDPPETTD